MKTLQLEKTPSSFRRTARLAKGGVLVLTEKGKPAFAIVGVKDELALEALALTRNEAFMAYLDAVSESARNGRTYSLKEIRAEFNLPAEGRKRKKRPAPKS
jgi:antitoxin (DNA-binding transcriptional repressor) of toxin-antitoxin stability system